MFKHLLVSALGLLMLAAAAMAQAQAQGAAASAQLIESSVWTVQVADEKRTRTLRIGRWLPDRKGGDRFEAWYGWSDRDLKAVDLAAGETDGARWVRFMTPAQSQVEATLTSPTTLEGTFRSREGRVVDARMTRQGAPAQALLEDRGARPAPTALGKIHLVYMGGADCPPCRWWLGVDLPRLKESPAFRAITFSKVDKAIPSAVPAVLFLPPEVRPLKPQLDAANAGMPGSAQVAVFVDGVLFDYYFGTRTAEQVLAMLSALEAGRAYPFQRCLQIGAGGACVRRPG